MGFFGKLVKAAINTATLPLSVVADVVTVGNVLDGEPFTKSKVEKILKDLEEAGDDAGESDWF